MIRCLLVFAAACGTVAQTPPPPVPTVAATSRPMPPPLEVTWSMKLDGGRLRIDYTVHNRTNELIVLVDRLRDNSEPTDLAIIRESGRPNTVAFTLAYVPQDRRVKTRERRPFARMLEARSSTTGTAYARWPLRSGSRTS